ncbi:hypothetical protein COUCH_22250 [Couchioplanes caeruleus]|uniref:cupredoxin domain-containing protein n=1 Tax=Couchioplanes caeruleus TaxID=56438 RepID=UPI0020C02218|nr:hypothetical protein [Couchioplanes caeruleus]UQU61762.1 hypothetical protein COUCH_22250 [Couchioplanes caeruleus]
MVRRLGLTGYAVVAVLALAACAPTAGTPGPRQTAAAGDRRAGPGTAGPTSAACTRATKVAIVDRTTGDGAHRYEFSPGTLTIQRGAFLAVTNRSPEVHELIAEPDAGLVTSVLDLAERQVIQFPEAGSFTVRSATEHRAVLRLTVAGESGCAAPKPTLTITGRDTVTPAHLSVAATENFAVVNDSAGSQTVTCSPDPGGNGDNSRVDPGESQLLAIDEPGRYICTSRQHPRLRATVTVSGRRARG